MRIASIKSLIAFALLIHASVSYSSQPLPPQSQNSSFFSCLLFAASGISSLAYGVYDWASKTDRTKSHDLEISNLERNHDQLLQSSDTLTVEQVDEMKSLSVQEKANLKNNIEWKRTQRPLILKRLEHIHKQKIAQLAHDATFEQKKRDAERNLKNEQSAVEERYAVANTKVFDSIHKRLLRMRNNTSLYRPHVAALVGISLLATSLGMLWNNK